MGFLSRFKSSAPEEKELIKLKGEIGETDLSNWLNTSGLSYVAVCQAKESFASLFLGEIKRPDFLVLLDSIGLIAIDAKNVEIKDWDGVKCLTLTLESEIKRAIGFERLFRIPLWYAFRAHGDEISWYWISALMAVEVGQEREGRHGTFLSIPLHCFVHIKSSEDIAKLYTQRLPSVRGISALPLKA